MDLILIIGLIICYITGSLVEKGHYSSIKKRELALYKTSCISYGRKLNSTRIKNAFLVSGSTVIGCDNFKAFIANLRNFFGGNVSAYESVLDRARREAVLRMRESAASMGVRTVINTKIDTIMLDPIGSHKKPKVCAIAYGTAIQYE